MYFHYSYFYLSFKLLLHHINPFLKYSPYNEIVIEILSQGGILMLTDIYYELKNWWVNGSSFVMENEEFERLESKHTRVHFDVDIYEIIRVR